MLGRICCTSAGRGETEAEEILGLDILTLRVPENHGARLLRRGAARLVRAGVRRVVVPENFAPWQILERRGLRRVDPAPLCSALAPAWALWKLDCAGIDPARAVVVLRGRRESPAMIRTALALCPRVRGLAVDVPGAKTLPVRLRREFGLPVFPLESGVADLTICFEPEAVLPGTAFFLAGKRAPYGCRDAALLCALWENGHLRPEEVGFEKNTDDFP